MNSLTCLPLRWMLLLLYESFQGLEGVPNYPIPGGADGIMGRWLGRDESVEASVVSFFNIGLAG